MDEQEMRPKYERWELLARIGTVVMLVALAWASAARAQESQFYLYVQPYSTATHQPVDKESRISAKPMSINDCLSAMISIANGNVQHDWRHAEGTYDVYRCRNVNAAEVDSDT